MFVAAKILALLTQPLAWVSFLLVLALFVQVRKPMLARWLVGASLTLLLLIGWQPLPEFFIRKLEQSYSEIAPGTDLKSYAGAVVLGGALGSGRIAMAHQQPGLNDSAERMTAPLSMLRNNPELQIVFTGGEGELFGTGPSEAQRAAAFFESFGVPATKVAYESASRNTYENAVLTAQMPGVDKRQRWLLLTSAWHMPRSMATFVKAGWNVTAYPVDFRTGQDTPWLEYSMREGVDKWQLLLHEWFGIVVYTLTGRM